MISDLLKLFGLRRICPKCEVQLDAFRTRCPKCGYKLQQGE